MAKMIVIEGIEGAGKSSAIKSVGNFLSDRQIPWIHVREPGGTAIGESLRKILKNSQDETLCPETELLLMYASRAQLYNHVIKESLEKGIWVLADRFELSSYAYQGYGRKIPLEYIRSISDLVLKGFKPDLTLVLDVSLNVSQHRISLRGIEKDRIEQEKLDFFENVRQGYLVLAEADERVKIIDANQSLEQVGGQIINFVSKL